MMLHSLMRFLTMCNVWLQASKSRPGDDEEMDGGRSKKNDAKKIVFTSVSHSLILLHGATAELHSTQHNVLAPVTSHDSKSTVSVNCQHYDKAGDSARKLERQRC